MPNEISLEELKKEYASLEKKYKLPDFEAMNKEFQIERANEHETDFLLREVRKIVAEKIFGYLRMVEALLNPSNAQMFVFSMVKAMGTKERKSLEEVYKELAKGEVEVIKLDLEYSEKDEAEFIKKSFSTWNKTKKEILQVVEAVEKNWKNKSEGKTRGYFG